MKVLVTGATGFVGSELIRQLAARALDVVGCVRSADSVLPVGVERFVVDDLTKIDINWPLVLGSVDVVVHAAARAHIMNDEVLDPLSEFRKVNCDATLRLARAAAESGVKRFVFISSIGVNGCITTQPFKELDNAHPHSPYAVSKYEAEQGLFEIGQETDMEVVIIRPPLIYGANAPGNFGSLMKWMQKGIPLPFGAIHNKRSLVALDNLVNFIALCADRNKSPKAANEVFLISDNEDVSTTELLRKVASAFGKRSWLTPIPVSWMTFAAKLLGKEDVAVRLFSSLQVDSSKACELLGWKPVVTMDEQLKKIADAVLNKKEA